MASTTEGLPPQYQNVAAALGDPLAYQEFLSFLETEFCQDNLLFVKRCQDYLSASDDAKPLIVEDIFARFLESGAVTLEPALSNSLSSARAAKDQTKLGKELNNAQVVISFELQKDSFKRFQKTEGVQGKKQQHAAPADTPYLRAPTSSRRTSEIKS